MKKVGLTLVFMTGLLLLGACSNAKDLTEYVDVEFSGMDSQGTADYNVNEEKLFQDVFDYDPDSDFPDDETAQEMDNMEDTYKIKLNKDEGLSNGDKVTVTVAVNDEKTDKIKGGEKEVTVKGLDEPKILTTDDVEKHLVLNFTGASGKGTAEMENTFDDPLNTIAFAVKDNGELSNGEQAEVMIDEAGEQSLNDNGYVLDKDFHPTYKVEGLYNVAEKATDIKNLKDIKRMIEEEMNREYKDKSIIGIQYKFKQEMLMYRQFDKDSDEQNNAGFQPKGTDDNGNLIGIYTVKEFDKFDKDSKYTVILGFSDIRLDKKGKANVAEIEKISDRKDDTYSLKSVIQLYEGYGYKEVKE